MTALFSFLSRSQQAENWAGSLCPSQHPLEDAVLAPCTPGSESDYLQHHLQLAVCSLQVGSCLLCTEAGAGPQGEQTQVLLLQPDRICISASTDREQPARQTCWEIKQCWLSLILIQSFINGSRHPGHSAFATWSCPDDGLCSGRPIP